MSTYVVGQKVVVIPMGNELRRYRDMETPLLESVVAKVGPKYVTLEGNRFGKFYKDTGRQVSDICSNFQIYATAQEYKDVVERKERMRWAIKQLEQNPMQAKITLDQLRQICAILSQGQEQPAGSKAHPEP